MNKFAILSVLFAVVAIAAASPVNLEESDEVSELQLKPDDDGEIAYLSEENQIFADYCKSSRDQVFQFITDKKKEGIAAVFTTIFGNVNEITQKLEEIQKAELEKVSDAIMNKAESTNEATGEETDSPGVMQSIAGLLSSYTKALAGAASEQLKVRYQLLKQSMNSETATEMIQKTCAQVQLSLLPELQKSFKDAKAEIMSSGPSAEIKSAVASAQYEKVGCITTGRVSKIVKICGLLSGGVSMIMELAGK